MLADNVLRDELLTCAGLLAAAGYAICALSCLIGPRFGWCLALAAALLDPALSAHLCSHFKFSDTLLTLQYSLSSKACQKHHRHL